MDAHAHMNVMSTLQSSYTHCLSAESHDTPEIPSVADTEADKRQQRKV